MSVRRRVLCVLLAGRLPGVFLQGNRAMLYGLLLPTPRTVLGMLELPADKETPRRKRRAEKRDAEALRLLLRADTGGLMK
jgi:hypothetical protein